jgi:hypothetical protein
MARMVALVAQRGGDLDTALEQVSGLFYTACSFSSQQEPCSRHINFFLKALRRLTKLHVGRSASFVA